MMFAVALLAAVFTRPLERVSTCDPAFAQAVYDSRVVQLMYETPLEIDYYARPYKLVPGACELPEVSSDGLTYTFRLRKERGGFLGRNASCENVDSAFELRERDSTNRFDRFSFSVNDFGKAATAFAIQIDERVVEVDKIGRVGHRLVPSMVKR
jgi:ABC-type oligopeptide transport system substrate-binding subunit